MTGFVYRERAAAMLAAVTFSIVARSDDGRSWGVAVASKFLAVGNVVPAAIAGIGALATQANANVAWKATGLTLLEFRRWAWRALGMHRKHGAP
ncbi:MAG TPA: DUF1028 domain-containing protein [Jatrophihabitans sp.]|jgi:uncharacterized Ntn-hydrolase superfamily protein